MAELHIIFDSPNRSKVHPKDIERERRDVPVDSNHEHIVFDNEMKIHWMSFMQAIICELLGNLLFRTMSIFS